jgi:hypothetical protein
MENKTKESNDRLFKALLCRAFAFEIDNNLSDAKPGIDIIDISDLYRGPTIHFIK